MWFDLSALFLALQFWADLRNAIRESSSQGQASEQSCSLFSRAMSALAVLSHCLGVTSGNHNSAQMHWYLSENSTGTLNDQLSPVYLEGFEA